MTGQAQIKNCNTIKRWFLLKVLVKFRNRRRFFLNFTNEPERPGGLGLRHAKSQITKSVTVLLQLTLGYLIFLRCKLF